MDKPRVFKITATYYGPNKPWKWELGEKNKMYEWAQSTHNLYTGLGEAYKIIMELVESGTLPKENQVTAGADQDSGVVEEPVA